MLDQDDRIGHWFVRDGIENLSATRPRRLSGERASMPTARRNRDTRRPTDGCVSATLARKQRTDTPRDLIVTEVPCGRERHACLEHRALPCASAAQNTCSIEVTSGGWCAGDERRATRQGETRERLTGREAGSSIGTPAFRCHAWERRAVTRTQCVGSAPWDGAPGDTCCVGSCTGGDGRPPTHRHPSRQPRRAGEHASDREDPEAGKGDVERSFSAVTVRDTRPRQTGVPARAFSDCVDTSPCERRRAAEVTDAYACTASRTRPRPLSTGPRTRGHERVVEPHVWINVET